MNPDILDDLIQRYASKVFMYGMVLALKPNDWACKEVKKEMGIAKNELHQYIQENS